MFGCLVSVCGLMCWSCPGAWCDVDGGSVFVPIPTPVGVDDGSFGVVIMETWGLPSSPLIDDVRLSWTAPAATTTAIPLSPLIISFYPPRLSGIPSTSTASIASNQLGYIISINSLPIQDVCVSGITVLNRTNAFSLCLVTIDATLDGCDWTSPGGGLLPKAIISSNTNTWPSFSVTLTAQNRLGKSQPQEWLGKLQRQTKAQAFATNINVVGNDPALASSSSSTSSPLAVSIVIPVVLLLTFAGVGAGVGGTIWWKKHQHHSQPSCDEVWTTNPVVTNINMSTPKDTITSSESDSKVHASPRV